MKKIMLTQGKEALVDDEDYEMLMEHKWYADKCWTTKDKFYVRRNSPRDSNGKHKTIKMHLSLIHI